MEQPHMRDSKVTVSGCGWTFLRGFDLHRTDLRFRMSPFYEPKPRWACGHSFALCVSIVSVIMVQVQCLLQITEVERLPTYFGDEFADRLLRGSVGARYVIPGLTS